MSSLSFRSLAAIACLCAAGFSHALTGVNPTGVNVNAHGPTSVFLTFQGTAGQVSNDAFWCGEITVPANTVTTFNPCVPGTQFGSLPSSLDLSRPSGTGGAVNVTDIMTIPASVARRAYQDAARGNKSSFFYVRRFSSGAGDQFVAVTCRMAGGGARVPLALLDVKLVFRTDEGDRPVTLLANGQVAPLVGARVFYNGSGRLKGRWELMRPGDPEPDPEDLLSEASLPVEQRGLQKRYTLLSRFDEFLSPTGEVFIEGPPSRLVPTDFNGPYKILFRVEATADKEGDSNTTAGFAQSGGVAGFPMPVLRYYVGSTEEVAAARARFLTGKLSLMLPQDDGSAQPGQPVEFSWVELPRGVLYRVELENAQGSVLSALVKRGSANYVAPPWLWERAGPALRWRVQALDREGDLVAQSNWRTLRAAQ